ncbi:MAG: hypothetical protein ACOCUF_01200 [Patescibacteria group bacterium]
MLFKKRKKLPFAVAKKIYFYMGIGFCAVLILILIFVVVETEKKAFYAKSRLVLNQAEISYLNIKQKMEKGDWEDWPSKKGLLKEVRNLEEKLFNLEVLYFKQKGDFSLKYFHFSDQEYLERIVNVRRIFIDGQRYIRTLENFLQQEQITENQKEIYRRDKNLFEDSLSRF